MTEVEGYGRALIHLIYNFAKEEDADIGTEEEVLKKITNVTIDFATPAASDSADGNANKEESGKAKEGESEEGGKEEKEAATASTTTTSAEDERWRTLLEDPTLADDDKFIDYLKRNAQKLIKSLEEIARLGQFIKSNEVILQPFLVLNLLI